ncbi:MAG: type 1 glutamine amidotransferase [Magnetococcales bacterium]|nr:type 1 glutamine amidotransferase [Magnetococcales bacterium]
MRIGYLRTGFPPVALQGVFGDYLGMFRAMLEPVLPGVVFEVFEVQRGHLPAGVGVCDAWLACGSDNSVYDDEPWLPPLMGFIREVHAAGKPYLGICFGHQLLAQALGGRVERAGCGLRLGVRSVHLQRRADWMQPFQQTVRLHHSHQDQVVVLPPGGEILASGEQCPCAMLAVGDHSLGVQGHPEFARDYMEAIIPAHTGRQPGSPVLLARESLAQGVDNELVAGWLGRFLLSSASV